MLRCRRGTLLRTDDINSREMGREFREAVKARPTVASGLPCDIEGAQPAIRSLSRKNGMVDGSLDVCACPVGGNALQNYRTFFCRFT